MNWQKCLDTSGIAGTILMDISKEYDCLPLDLLIGKLAAFDRAASFLITDYLTTCLQHVKIAGTNLLFCVR